MKLKNKAVSVLCFIAVLIFASGLVTDSFAGDQYNCVISGVGVFSGNHGWYLQCDGGERQGAPSCVVVPHQWGKSWTEENSKEIYALAMTMWLTGKPVRLNGTDTCTPNFNGRENLNGLERYGM